MFKCDFSANPEPLHLINDDTMIVIMILLNDTIKGPPLLRPDALAIPKVGSRSHSIVDDQPWSAVTLLTSEHRLHRLQRCKGTSTVEGEGARAWQYEKHEAACATI